MRDDMFKVIVERPRKGSRHTNASGGRIFRNSEDVASKLGIKRGHQDRKYLNENLAPLRRYLESQVGRPWNKVYAELSQGIDRRNTVQEHIYAHIESYVAVHTQWLDTGEGRASNGACVRLIGSRWWGATGRLADSHVLMYVHPLTGILLNNRYRRSYSERARQRRAKDEDSSRLTRIVISQVQEFHRIDELWFAIDFTEFAALPVGQTEMVWDVLQKAVVSGSAPKRYACRKRQLNSRELVVLKKAHPGLFLWESDRLCADFPLNWIMEPPSILTAHQEMPEGSEWRISLHIDH
jgi:hypothetical protein